MNQVVQEVVQEVVQKVSTLNKRANIAFDSLITQLKEIIHDDDVNRAVSNCHDLYWLLSSDKPESSNLHNALKYFEPRIKNILKLLKKVPVNLPPSMQTGLVDAKNQMGKVLVQMDTLLLHISSVPKYIDSMREKMQKSHADKDYCETLDFLRKTNIRLNRLLDMISNCMAILNRLNAIILDSLKLADSGHSPSNTIFTTTGLRRKTSKGHHSASSRSVTNVNIVSDDDFPKSSHLAKSTSTHSSGRSMKIRIVSPDSQQSARSSSRQSTKKTHHANTVSPDKNENPHRKLGVTLKKKSSQLNPNPPLKKRTNTAFNHPGRNLRVSSTNGNLRPTQSH
jgi:hypothetical protein